MFWRERIFNVNNEITIWKNLLKWACGQKPVIQQDINKWSKNEFTMIEGRLSRFIPLVRFYQISSEDFLSKVYPFKVGYNPPFRKRNKI